MWEHAAPPPPEPRIFLPAGRRPAIMRNTVIEKGAVHVTSIGSEELLLLAGRGSRKAMGEFYRRYRTRVLSFLLHMGVGFEQADDMAQDVFLRIWRGAARYRRTGKCESYLFAAAANAWRDHRRREKLRSATSLEDQPEPTDNLQPLDGGSVRAEFREDLYQALLELSDNERMAFVLSEMQGLSYKEAARIMRCRAGTVGSRKTRAIARLRKLLVKHAPESYLKEAANDEMSK